MIIQTWGDPSDLKKQENKQMKRACKFHHPNLHTGG